VKFEDIIIFSDIWVGAMEIIHIVQILYLLLFIDTRKSVDNCFWTVCYIKRKSYS